MYVVVRKRHVHGQHDQPREEPVGVWEVLGEAKRFQLVDGLATPLDECADAVLLEVPFELVAVLDRKSVV